MAATPLLALPYPAPTAPVSAGAADIQALATAVEQKIAGQLAYVEKTTAVSVALTAEASAQLVVAAPALTLDGATPVLIEFFAPAVTPPAVAGATLSLLLYRNGVSIGFLSEHGAWAAAGRSAPAHVMRRMTPAVGSNQFSIAAIVSGGTGYVNGGPGGLGQYLPAFVRIARA